MTESINDEAVYRTAPATPGLLYIVFVIFVVVAFVFVGSHHKFLVWFYIINRPGVAGAVLQTPS